MTEFRGSAMEKKEKVKKPFNPVWFLIIGIAILIVPSAVYMGFLFPRMSEEYSVMMASGAGIGGAGMFGTGLIPETAKYGTLYKTASKATTLLVVITLVKNFIGQLIGLAATFAVSYIIFLLMRSLWKDGKQARQNAKLANEVARGITEAT